MGEQTKNMLIGLFVVAACFLVVSLVLFLKPHVGDGKQTIYVRFSNINKINIGTRVMFAGRPIGEVVAVDEIHDARKTLSTDLLGRIYFYQLILKIDSHVKIFDTDEISIQTSGLLGEKSIAITPKSPPKGVIPTQVTTQPIYAESTDPLENAFLELSDLANNLQVTIKELNRWMSKNGEELGLAVRSFNGAMNEVHLSMKSLNDLKVISDLKTSINAFTTTLEQIQASIGTLQQSEVFTNTGIVMNNLKETSTSLVQITSQLTQGKGTLGQLIGGDDLYLRLTAIMSKFDTLMNDVNHYGVLFHLNKSWQRQRLQRITALNALDSPYQFRSYFEHEVDGINTSMSRLSELIDKAQASPEKELILSEDQFKKEFAELLRQADALSSNLRLYNQQLIEAEGCSTEKIQQ